MLTLIICIVAALYLAIAIVVFRFVSRHIQTGVWRPVARGTVIALFFSVGFAGGHGSLGIFPVWMILLSDAFNGDFDGAPLLSAFFQWLVPVVLFLIGYFGSARPNDARNIP